MQQQGGHRYEKPGNIKELQNTGNDRELSGNLVKIRENFYTNTPYVA